MSTGVKTLGLMKQPPANRMFAVPSPSHLTLHYIELSSYPCICIFRMNHGLILENLYIEILIPEVPPKVSPILYIELDYMTSIVFRRPFEGMEQFLLRTLQTLVAVKHRNCNTCMPPVLPRARPFCITGTILGGGSFITTF